MWGGVCPRGLRRRGSRSLSRGPRGRRNRNGQQGFYLHAQGRIPTTCAIQERGSFQRGCPLQRLPVDVLLPAAGRWFRCLHGSLDL
jgi:hypothetical protein